MSLKIILKKPSTIDVLTALMVVSTVALRNFQYLLYAIQGLYLVYSLANIKHMDFRFFFARGFFVTMAVASMMWATSQSSVASVLPSIVQIFILCFALSSYFYRYEKLEDFVTIILLSAVVLSVNLLVSTSASEWREIIYFADTEYIDAASASGRIGPSINMHPNAFGATVAISLVCCFYRLYHERKMRYFLLMCALVVWLALAKSRSAMFVSIIGIISIWVTQQKKISKQINTLFIAVVCVLIFFWTAVNIPALYTLFGYRLEGFLNIFGGGDSADSSTMGRWSFIKIGLNLFADNPILGIGMNNFSYLAFRNFGIWAEVSAHNNFVEILADLGIIGFIAYYSLFVTTFFKLCFLVKQIKKYNMKELKIVYLLFGFLLTFAVMEFFFITYSIESVQFINMFVFAGTNVIANIYNDMQKL